MAEYTKLSDNEPLDETANNIVELAWCSVEAVRFKYGDETLVFDFIDKDTAVINLGDEMKFVDSDQSVQTLEAALEICEDRQKRKHRKKFREQHEETHGTTATDEGQGP